DRTREYLNKFMGSFTCGSCKGARLNKNALAVWINAKNINDYIQLSISDCLIEIENLVENHLTNQEKQISNLITKEIINRVTFLKNVGLTYLNLNRAAETLSGGEAQR
ncbi:excinuclease ABC subunit UvrA, partial [Mycoplasmopsis synoviae]